LQFLLASVYFQQKDFTKAEASARQALSLDPETPDAHALLGDIYSAKGLKDEAAKEFKAEIKASPNKTANYLVLASLYSEQGKWQDEISVLEKAHTVDPSSPIVANNLAYLYMEHGGDPHVALSLAQGAKSGMPNSPVTADTLGWAFYKVGYYEPAIAQLSIATQKVPDRAAYQYHLGMAYLGAGRLGPAAQSLQQALKIDANFADAGNARAALDTIAKRPQAQGGAIKETLKP
jgi:Tfp pilus assembly protein PilF